MGGIIKITIKENNELTTVDLHTAYLSARYSALGELFQGITPEQMIEDSDGEISDSLTPESYGHVFIDRDNKHIFNLNDFNSFNKISLAKIINNLNEYADDPEPEKNTDDPRFEHTNNSFLFNLQSSIDASNTVVFMGINEDDNETMGVFQENEKDALTLARKFVKTTETLYQGFKHPFIYFQNNEWTIVDYCVGMDSLLLFKQHLESLGLEIEEEEFQELIREYQ